MKKRVLSLAMCMVIIAALLSGCALENASLKITGIRADDLAITADIAASGIDREAASKPGVKAETVALLYAYTEAQKKDLSSMLDKSLGAPAYMTKYPANVISRAITAEEFQAFLEDPNETTAFTGSVSGTLAAECDGQEVEVRAVFLCKAFINDTDTVPQRMYIVSPKSRLTIEVKTPAVTYPVTNVTADPNGIVLIDKEQAAAGETVTVTAAANAGFAVESITVNDGDVALTDGKFQMPEGEAKVAVTFKALPVYAITNDSVDPHGTVTIDRSTAYAGETVTVAAVPMNGYLLDSITVNGGAVEVTDGKFTMPDGDVSVVVTFAEKPTYAITVDEAENGTVTVDKETACEGETVTVTAKPDKGYVLQEITVNDGAVTVTDGKFTMPAEAVTVTAVFEAKPVFTITVEDNGNGTVTVDKETACEGETVTVTAEPKPGFNLVTIVVKDASGKELTVTDGKFTMPASNVKVYAGFQAKPLFGIVNTTTDHNGTVAISTHTAWEGQEVTITTAPKDGFVVDTITVKDSSGREIPVTDGKFIMPASDVTVTVTFKDGHVHNFDTGWKADAESHWRECSCGETKDEGAHTFDSKGKCSVCEFTNNYKIVQGANGTWDKKTTTGYTLVSNADYSKFVKVVVDGKGIDKSYYTSRSGSTSITLKKTYLDSLSVGDHTVKIQSTDGAASTKLTITNKSSTAKTGDNSNLALWLVVLLTASIILTAVMLYDRVKDQIPFLKRK